MPIARLHNTSMDCKETKNKYPVKPKTKPCLKNTLDKELDKKETQIEYNSKDLQSNKGNSLNAEVVKVEVQHEINHDSKDLLENDCTLVKTEIVNDSEDIEKIFNQNEKKVIKAEQPNGSDLEDNIHQYEFEGLDFLSVKAEPLDGTDAEILAGEGNQQSDNLGDKFIHSEETVIKAEPKDEISYEVADNQQFDSLDEKFKCIERTVIKIEPKEEFSFKTEPKEEIIHEVKCLNFFNMKVEPENLNDTEMLYSEDGVDGGLRRRLKGDEISLDPNGNSMFAHYIHLWTVMVCICY